MSVLDNTGLYKQERKIRVTFYKDINNKVKILYQILNINGFIVNIQSKNLIINRTDLIFEENVSFIKQI